MTETEHTTLVSLFHTEEQAQETLAELQNSGIPTSAVQTVGGRSNTGEKFSDSSLRKFDLPEKDLRMLSEGIQSGGTVVIVTANGEAAEKAEDIFRRHHAKKVDEQVISDREAVASPLAAASTVTDVASSGVIPIVEEELVVGKRAKQSGGIRVISRVTETPVNESVTLQEEHAVIERRPVNRDVSEADLHAFRDETFEVIEKHEEAVVSKTATVVEEVIVGKESSQRTEKITDSVRRTEVEVEQVAADEIRKPKGKRS